MLIKQTDKLAIKLTFYGWHLYCQEHISEMRAVFIFQIYKNRFVL